MRRYGEASSSHPPPPAAGQPGSRSADWNTLRRLLPYLWQYKWRVVAALAFMVGAKLANVGVPVLLKNLVDAMSIKPGDPRLTAIPQDDEKIRVYLGMEN